MTVLTALYLAGVWLAAPAEAVPAKPNVLVLYSDDQGWADLGVQGVDPDIRTPHLDQLARDGVRFVRGYVSAPQCVPSRAGLMTGRYQERFGVEDNTKGPLPLEEVTIAERLRTAGYVTGMSGKWHLDLGPAKPGQKQRSLPDHLPYAQGFDEYFTGTLQDYIASHDLSGQPFADAPHKLHDDRFRVVIQTEAALSFLERRAARPQEPWFLYVAWMAPHVPLQSAEPWFSATPAHLPLERRQALAAIAAIDEGVGRIRDKLRQLGAERNTLIFFISDNGAPIKEGAWDGSINRPMIGEKGMLTNGGTRVPFVAAWPGTIPAAQVYEHPVINLDVAATAVAAAGLPPDAKLDGVDLVPYLTGRNRQAPHDRLYWRWRSQAAVLEFPWKLVRLGPDQRLLFDVTTPEGEKKDLLAEHPEIAARLEVPLATWCDTLQPPGIPKTLVDGDAEFFADHVDPRLAALAAQRAKPGEPAGSVQGWLCRNGSAEVHDGALVVTPDAQAGARQRPFITHTALDLAGPVRVTLSVRGTQAGQGSLSWRTAEDRDFLPAATAAFDWPGSPDWRDVSAEAPLAGRMVHVRIALPSGDQKAELRSIRLTAADGKVESWNFGPVAKPPAADQPALRPIRCRNGVLVYDDGREVALWGVNLQTALHWEYTTRMKPCGIPLEADALKRIADQNLDEMRQLGVGIVRMHLCPSDFTDAQGDLRDTIFLDLFDYTLAGCSQRGIYVYLTLLNEMGQVYVPDSFLRPRPGDARWSVRKALMADEDCVRKTEHYIGELLTRTNRYTRRPYKDEPALGVIEVMNEPSYVSYAELNDGDRYAPLRERFQDWLRAHGEVKSPEAGYAEFRRQLVGRYIGRMYAAIRGTGARQPVAWNLNWPRMIKGHEDVFRAAAESPVEVISFCLYPGQDDVPQPFWQHPASLDAKNYLPFLRKNWEQHERLRWLLDEQFAGKAKAVYEFETFYNQTAYLYPAMARLFRALGAQIAQMWTYSLTPTAERLGGSHHLNLYCTPRKAVSFVAAGAVFGLTPRLTPYDYPADDDLVFGPAAVSFQHDLSVVATPDVLIHSGPLNAWQPIPVSRSVRRIVGCGSSPLATYDGSGAYFIDVDEDRVEIVIEPDARFLRPHWQRSAKTPWEPSCELDSATPHRLALRLPGWEFVDLLRLDGPESHLQGQGSARAGFDVTPGRYRLVRKAGL